MFSHNIEILGTTLFAIAIVHSFVASSFMRLSHRWPAKHFLSVFFHLIGEIEIVFGLWGFVLLGLWSLIETHEQAMNYFKGLHFVEPVFVFCIMLIASTSPIMYLVKKSILLLSRFLQRVLRFKSFSGQSSLLYIQLFTLLVLGPLSGSYITEPAAMTVTALALNMMLKGSDKKILYPLLGLLFVNVSIGGALTSFAAPPILMVAAVWQWSSSYVFFLIGYKSIIAVTINTIVFLFLMRRLIPSSFHPLSQAAHEKSTPWWLVSIHLAGLVFLIFWAHEPIALIAILCLFLAVTSVTQKHQSTLFFRQSFLVAFFLGGIIVFGSLQRWWLEPLLMQMSSTVLFFGATALTAFTDNAALTYLGAQVESLPQASRYFLVGGALAGGGLSLIANAPNAAGFAVLQKRFNDGLESWLLFKGALIPTLITVIVYLINF